MFEQCNLNVKKWLGTAFALGAMITACSTETAGTSEESEGIVALASKKVGGSVQKGPFVKGSDVVLRETSADGSLEPTGRTFETTVVNDKGDFEFGNLDLESQYALLSAEGHYTHDVSGERSHCVLHLNAVSNLEKRKTVNINLLTHFEYKRVLYLVKQGKAFAEAKRQAAKEVLNAFGVDVHMNSAEDLDIYKSSDADRTLYHISIFVDTQGFYYPMGEDDDEWEFRQNPANIDCSALQNFVDSYADDLAEDGTLSDSLMASLVHDAYLTLSLGNVMYEGEVGAKGRDEYDLMAERTYFYELVLDHYLDFGKCGDKNWGESRRLDKPFGEFDYDENKMKYVNPSYFICDGLGWVYVTKGHLDSLRMVIPHENGSMTDLRDGHEYKTVSFEYEGKNYEWMAEDLKYESDGIYTWTDAMRIDDKYMTEVVDNSLIGEVHQGICPDGWHVSSTKDWNTLVVYVGGLQNLLDSTWRTDKKTAEKKGLSGVFFNRFDFNLVPMDKKYLELKYHSYAQGSYYISEEIEKERDDIQRLIETAESKKEREKYESMLSFTRDPIVGVYAVDISMRPFAFDFDFVPIEKKPQKKARVRCVKD